MKFRTDLMFSAVCAAALMAAGNVWAYGGRLSPQNFNKMYYLATKGKVGILRDAVNRGLNIDAMNAEGDTGLCVAVKRENYIAYNTFRMSGANPRHPCTYRMYNEYQDFLNSRQAANADRIIGNEESLYYQDDETSWWPWILGGAAVGGGALALSSGGGSKSKPAEGDDTIIPTDPGYGLTALIDNYRKLYNNVNVSNTLKLDASNPNGASVTGNIKFLPNMLDNADYLQAYIKVINGGYFNNMFGGGLRLGDAAVGAAAYGKGSTVSNNGIIEINARNGAIGLAASNSATVFNNPDRSTDELNGNINMAFSGGNEGDAVIGMYADTGSRAINYGKITGTTTYAETGEDNKDTGTDIPDIFVDDSEGEGTANKTASANSGTMLGMALFNFYTGTNNSGTSVRADNYGDIQLSAGYNNAADSSVSLIGMGSYIDDKFLNGHSNPAYAEKMFMHNYGNIKLSYQGQYALADTALKLGDGGLIGMRADASTFAQNTGNIDIDLQNAVIGSAGTDVAAGLLSVHGGGLTNGTVGFDYDGSRAETGGTIRILNQAKAGGTTYGMLAAKGDGTQTRVYDWSQPKLYNYGLIDMRVSNAYGMASFAGGEIVNKGVINLGFELGQSYYTNNYGLYAAGDSLSDQVSLINDGIINVYSEQSTALYNAFAGSVSLQNNGTVYVSHKAKDSKVFGGNFSEAVNNGSVIYKVDNSEEFSATIDSQGRPVISAPIASVMWASSNNDTTRQYIVNNGTFVIGATLSEADYNGTYGTAGMLVSKQGSASNNNVIILDMYNRDTLQGNIGMVLDSTTRAGAAINNRGTITVNATLSEGMRNDSQNRAEATNWGTIWLNGNDGAGMHVTDKQGLIFNGRYGFDDNPQIHVKGSNSVGMYVENGTAYNYGTISLEGDDTTAFLIEGADAVLAEAGTITHQSGLENATYFWANENAVLNLRYDDPITVDGYTLGKATYAGSVRFGSTAYVSGSNSHLLVAASNGKVYNQGTVYAQNGTMAIAAGSAGSAYNQGTLNVSGSETIGMYGQNSQTFVSTDGRSSINVSDGGTGIRAEDAAQVENNGSVNVTGGTGIYLSDGTTISYTLGTNTGNINVTGDGNKGVVVVNGAHFDNENGKITASGGAEGIRSSAEVTNNGTITANDSGIGIYAVAGNVRNYTDIVVNGDSAYGIYNTGATAKNDGGTITVNSGTGVYGAVENKGEIKVYSDGTGVDGNIKNSGTITVNESGTGVRGSGSNIGSITNNGVGAGVVVTGDFTNSGTIDGNTLGVKVEGGRFNNAKNITIVNGTGVYVTSGSAVNNGTITVGNGKGIHVDGASSTATNYGTIAITESGYGAYVTNSGKFINGGKIMFDSEKGGHCANVGVGGTCEDASEDKKTKSISPTDYAPIFVGENAAFVNKGQADFGKTDVDFDTLRDESGAFVIASGGTYAADSFKGDVVAGKDIVTGGFDDTYTNQNSFAGRNEGLNVSSESYMFDASLKDKNDTVDVELNRKSFDDLVEEKDLAAFFETNYGLQNNEKMFNALKAAEDKKEFNATVEKESGKTFYANLQRENMAVLRGLNTQEQNRILEDGLNGRSVGADYYRTGKDASGGLSGYADDVYSAYLGFGGKLSGNWSMGGTLRAAYADADYDEARSSRENKILMAFLPIMYQNGNMTFLAMPEVGVGYGSYKRKAVSGSYDADTLDLYYGLYNHAEYSVDMKVAELVAEAELNLQGSSMSKAKEDEGLNLHANNSLSLESGVGVKLRKRVALAKERSLMLAVGVKYYHEFLDPYKDLTVGMNGSPVRYHLNGYDENKDRIRTSAEAVYKDGDFSVAAEIAHNAEKESNVEGGLGVRCNF